MTDPRFRPSGVFLNVRDFGRSADPPVNPDCLLTESEVAWALFQHKASFAVLLELRHLGESLSSFAARLDVNELWLKRKLRGHVPADLAEILSWALVLGVHVLPVINDSDDLSL